MAETFAGTLAVERIGSGPAPGVSSLPILHGIYGRGRNWGAVARELVDRRPDWAPLLVDLRLHGRSVGFEPPHTIEAAAQDVIRTLPGEPVAAVLGHSFGGKVALLLAEWLQPGGQVWIVESTPDAREPGGSAWRLLDAVKRLPARFASRDDVIQRLEAAGIERLTAQWMAANLGSSEGGYRWRLDLQAVEELLRDFFRRDLWSIVEAPPDGVTLRFVKAEASSTLDEPACRRLEEIHRQHGRVTLDRLAGGHWLNVDNPAALVELLVQGLPRRGLP